MLFNFFNLYLLVCLGDHRPKSIEKGGVFVGGGSFSKIQNLIVDEAQKCYISRTFVDFLKLFLYCP